MRALRDSAKRLTCLLSCTRRPIFRGPSPPSRAQRLFNRFAVIVAAAACCVLALWEAYSCAQIAFGYAAGYSFASALFLAIAIALCGLILLIYWRTRPLGISLVVSGLLSYGLFLGGIACLSKLDLVAWRHEPPPKSFGPDQKSALVIYFRKGTTDQQIEDFITSVLEEPAQPRHDGRDYPVCVSSYLGLRPSQANKFEAAAVDFFDSARERDTAPYIAKIRSDPRVDRVFLNVSPQSIRLDSIHR